jgi:hypothetical protein
VVPVWFRWGYGGIGMRQGGVGEGCFGAKIPVSPVGCGPSDSGDNVQEFMSLLANSFNPATVESLMCRTTLSVGWMGEVYDCDFNQMLAMQVRNGKPLYSSRLRKLASALRSMWGWPVSATLRWIVCGRSGQRGQECPSGRPQPPPSAAGATGCPRAAPGTGPPRR